MQAKSSSRCGISLRELVPGSFSWESEDVRITACTSSASECQPGDLYVAITESDSDGHESVQQAVQRGAAAVLAERYLPVQVPICVVPDTREAFGDICHELAGRPTDQLTTVGVTGTNGKSVTSHLLAAIYRAAEHRAAVSSTIERFDGAKRLSPQRTTGAATDTAGWLARSAANGCSHAVIEASSQGLAQRRLAGCAFDAVVLTNVRRDHLDFHGSTLNYRKAKGRIFDLLKPEGFAVLNADDAASQFFLQKLTTPVITFGQREEAEITATVIERFQGEQTMLLTAGCETVPVRTRMIGDHHVSNCLAATATALVMGIPLTTIARGLESVESLSGRLERVECGQEFGVFVDCADTPDRLAVALRSVRQVTPGRVICLCSGDAERETELPMLGRVLERASDLGVITSQSLAVRHQLETAHQILDGYDHPASAHVIPSRTQAIKWALETAEPGDSVVIAGSDRRATLEQNKPIKTADFELARRWLLSEATAVRPATLSLVP